MTNTSKYILKQIQNPDNYKNIVFFFILIWVISEDLSSVLISDVWVCLWAGDILNIHNIFVIIMIGCCIKRMTKGLDNKNSIYYIHNGKLRRSQEKT